MLHVPSMEGLGRWPWATAERAELNPTLGTGTRARRTAFFLAGDERFKAVVGRPLRKVAATSEQGTRDGDQTARKANGSLAAEGRTAQPRGDAEQCFVMNQCLIRGLA